MLAGIGGHAVLGDPEHARDLYAAAAAAWHDAGHARHGVFVPASDAALVDAWFRLSFGAAAALATRETTPEPPPEPAVDDPTRHAGRPRRRGAARSRDVPTRCCPRRASPSFRRRRTRSCVDEWRGTWDEEQFVHFVAERDGEVVAHILLYRRPHDLRVPRDSIDLAPRRRCPRRAARAPGAR